MANLNPATYLNIYSPGDSPHWTLAAAGAYGYEVYDLWGALVASGTSNGTTTVTIPPPPGGWAYGSYRVFLPTQVYSSNFTVIDQADTRFTPKPTNFSPYAAYGFGNPWIATYDPAMRGIFGIGVNRITVKDVGADPTAYAGINAMLKVAQAGQSWYHNPAYADPTHPREQLCALGAELSASTRAVDYIIVNNASGPGFANQSFNVYVASPAISGATTFVSVAAGTTSGYKLTVYSPNSTTAVETFDNLASTAAGQTAVNASSAYIRLFDSKRGGNPAPLAATAIGNVGATATANLAGQFYAAGVNWFEGPWNEPQGADPTQIAHEYMLWAASVKSGAPNAKTCGPGPVTFNTSAQGFITTFLAKVDRTYLDGLTVHAYNTYNGDVRLARQCFTDLAAILAAQGLSKLPIWQTEQGWQWPWYGVDRGRTAVNYYLMFMLLEEQYGIPLERNYVWYDVDNYYWLMSLVKGDGNAGVLHPLVPAIRTLAGERFGKNYTGALDFGTPGNDHYLGNLYTAADGSKSLALLNCGEGDGGQVAFTVTGATTLTRLDCWGNATPVTVTGGQVTIAVDNTPTYLRVPAGATATPVKRDYGTNLLSGATVIPSGGSKAAASRVTTPGLWSSYYLNAPYTQFGSPTAHSPWQSASATLPQTVTMTLSAPATANTIVVRAATLWQDLTTLLDFDVQVSPDGTTWTTVYTYTKNPADGYVLRRATEETQNTAFQSNAEQWDDERFLWVVPFTARSVKAVQLVIRAVTPGGTLDATTAALSGNNGGAGSTYPTLTAVQLYNATTSAPPTGNPYVVRTIV